MIGIIDYGAGNIASVYNALTYIGQEARILRSADEIPGVDALVFPGQGSFGSMVDNLRSRGIFEPLRRQVEDGTPFLGICLGLQILFEGSEESPGYEGFGIMRGTCTRFTRGKVPQIGWNTVRPLGEGMPEGWAYFVNSYRVESSAHALALTDYYGDFVSAVRRDAVTAFQFHPEKSGPYGLYLLTWWFSCWQNE